MYINFAAYVISLIVIEAVHVLFINKHKKYGYLEGFTSIKNTMSLTEFNDKVKEGKRYTLYNGYVINLFMFAGEHPGGRFLLDLIVGKDCGQFLDGSQTNVGGSKALKGAFAGKPHLHSGPAYKILRSLAIAKLVDHS